MKKTKVGILGATGMVGQRFIQLLEGHPWFEVTALAASERSAGKSYAEAVEGRWKVSATVPRYAAGMQVEKCEPGADCELVFSAMDAGVAGPIERAFAKAGKVVASNSRNHRMEPDVPLLVPEVNAEHLEAVKRQKYGKGFIVTNPNCSTITLVLALAPLYKEFGLKRVAVTTMQALSGAGYPGVASLDILDNVLPFIGGEEEKMEVETRKIFGELNEKGFEDAGIDVSAQCNRVNVKDGHLEAVSVELEKKVEEAEVVRAFEEFNPLAELRLPTSPTRPVVVMREQDRPQPKYDREIEKGMASVVGRIRKCGVLDYKFLVLGHNTIRGAAGASILNAELMKAKGYL